MTAVRTGAGPVGGEIDAASDRFAPWSAARCQLGDVRHEGVAEHGGFVLGRTHGARGARRLGLAHHRLRLSTTSSSASRSRVQRSSREVLPAAVGEERHDRAALHLCGQLLGRDHDGTARRDAREDALALGQVAERRRWTRRSRRGTCRRARAASKISGMKPSSSERRPWTRSPGQRLGGVDAHGGVVPAQPPADAHERAAGAQAGHEHVHLGAVGDDLLGGGLLVGPRVRRVAVLVGHDEALRPARRAAWPARPRRWSPSCPGESMISAPNSASSWRRSRVTLSGRTTATR